MKVDPEDLASAAELAPLLGVGATAIANYASRHADFPRPLATVGAGKIPVYSRSAVLE